MNFTGKMRLLTIFVLVAFAIGMLAGCSSEKKSSTAQKDLQKVRLAISTWSGFGPLFIAREKGFFAEQGLDVDIKIIEGLAERKQALASKNLDGLAITFDIAATVVDNGLPVKIIWALADSYGADGLLVKPEINSVQDLKGKTVAFNYGTASHILLTAILEKNGMTEQDIKPLQMTAGDAGAAFVAGKIDAALTWEPWLSKAQNAKVLASSKDFPGMIVDTIALRADYVQNNPAVPQKIVNAMAKAMKWYYANKENTAEGNKIMAKAFGVDVNEFTQGLETIKLYNYEENVEMFGTPEKPGVFYNTMERAAELYLKAKKINKKPDPKEVIDPSYLKNVKL